MRAHSFVQVYILYHNLIGIRAFMPNMVKYEYVCIRMSVYITDKEGLYIS